jgi:hypothetical protein
MSPDAALREHLRKLLDWEDAHVGYEAAVEGIPARLRGVVPAGLAHSCWQLVEHLRLTQWDILDFCRNAAYAEPSSMDAYWPAVPEPPSEAAWETSLQQFRRDRDGMKALAQDPAVDLFARIPHGAGQTCLRELLLVADHNAYHVGQLVLVRRALGIWR